MTEPSISLDAPVQAAGATERSTLIDALDRRLPWVMALVALAIGLSIIDSLPVGIMHDDGMYVILAKSLATGHGYRWLHLPDAPSATHFPPGYPAVLALLWWIFPAFPANVLAFKVANACFTAASAYLLVRFMRERWQFRSLSVGLYTALVMFGIPILALSSMVMSEPLFLTLTLAALLLAERVVDGAEKRPVAVAALGLLVGFDTLVRSHGIALVAAMSLVLLLRRRWRDVLLFVAPAFALLLPWQLWVSVHSGLVPEPMGGNYESYGKWLSLGIRTDGIAILWRTAMKTIPMIGSMIGPLSTPSMPGWPRITAMCVLGVLAAIGARPIARRAPVTGLFLLAYMAIVILWPFAPARFLWCLWPLVLLPVVVGARTVFTWRPPAAGSRVARYALLAGAVLVAAGHTRYTVRGYSGHWWASIARTNAAMLRPLVQWAQRTPPRAVLGVEEESTVYLYTGRRTVPIQTFTAHQFFVRRSAADDAAAMRSILAGYHVDAVAVSSAQMRAAARILATASPPQLAVVDTFPDGLVLVPVR